MKVLGMPSSCRLRDFTKTGVGLLARQGYGEAVDQGDGLEGRGYIFFVVVRPSILRAVLLLDYN